MLVGSPPTWFKRVIAIGVFWLVILFTCSALVPCAIANCAVFSARTYNKMEAQPLPSDNELSSMENDSNGLSEVEGLSDFEAPPKVRSKKLSAPRPLKQKPPVNISNRPTQVLKVGAIWRHEKNAGTIIQADFIRQSTVHGQRRPGHIVAYSSSGKNGFVIQCASDIRQVARSKAKCSFCLRAYSVDGGDPRVVEIKECNLVHGANCGWSTGVVERKHSTHIKHVEAATKSTLGVLQIPAAGPKNTGHTKVVTGTVLAAGDGDLSRYQVGC